MERFLIVFRCIDERDRRIFTILTRERRDEKTQSQFDHQLSWTGCVENVEERKRKNPHLVDFLFSRRCLTSVHFLLFSVQVPSSNSESIISILMSAVSHLTFVFFLISNVCLANISKDFSTKKYCTRTSSSTMSICWRNLSF